MLLCLKDLNISPPVSKLGNPLQTLLNRTAFLSIVYGISMYSALHTICLASVTWTSCLQIIPESGTPVAVAFRGTIRNRKVPAGTHCHVHVGSAACSQLCSQRTLPAQDSANIHGNRGRGSKWHTYPGLGHILCHFQTRTDLYPKPLLGHLGLLGQFMKLEGEPKFYRKKKKKRNNLKGKS